MNQKSKIKMCVKGTFFLLFVFKLLFYISIYIYFLPQVGQMVFSFYAHS